MPSNHVAAGATFKIKCSPAKRITLVKLYHTNAAAATDNTLNSNILYQTGNMHNVLFDKETDVTLVAGAAGYIYVEWEETN